VNILIKAKMYFPLILILLVGLLSACGSPAPAVTPLPGESSEPSEVATTPPTEPSELPETTTPQDESLGPPDRVDVVYFHRPLRCVTCLCFEEKIRHVVKTYFQDEVDSGKLTLEVLNLGDEENAAIVNKYGAFGPQLFINSVRGGTDHIKNIEEIWSWNCRSDEEGFEEAVRIVIEQSLEDKQ